MNNEGGFYDCDFRIYSIESPKSGNYDYSDKGSQGLQFDRVLITINQKYNDVGREKNKCDT